MSLRKFDESVPSPRCPWNAANITVTDPTVAVHVADQEASACLGGGQGVAHSVMDVSQGDRYLLLVAGLTVEGRQERVRIISTLRLPPVPQLVDALSAPSRRC